MSEEKLFRINLPTLFERVNERRREQGLPAVEPAMMAVRASIKFAIRQQSPVDLKGEKVEVSEAEADALCQTLGELFNVDLSADAVGETSAPTPVPVQPPPTGTADDGPSYILPLFQFYAAINRERRARGLHPVEPAVISVRTGIKFSILRRRTLDFHEDRLLLSQADLAVLDTIIAQQFDVRIPGGLSSLAHEPELAEEKVEGGLLDRLFTRLKSKPAARQTHLYSLDTNNLLLSIITRRAYMGHKPITPDKVRSRCGKALSAELELEMDPGDEKIALPQEQLDAFADAIRKEFDIMFEDLDDLLGRKPRN